MNLDKEKTLAFINQVLFVAALVAKLTPNTNDDAVVVTLQRVVANKDLVDLIFELLAKVHEDKKADISDLVAKVSELHHA